MAFQLTVERPQRFDKSSLISDGDGFAPAVKQPEIYLMALQLTVGAMPKGHGKTLTKFEQSVH
jgi:hypothetical protein